VAPSEDEPVRAPVRAVRWNSQRVTTINVSVFRRHPTRATVISVTDESPALQGNRVGAPTGFLVLELFVTAVSLIQAIIPDHFLGRTNASRRFVNQGMVRVGAPQCGALGTAIGLRPTIAIGAIGAAVGVLPLFVSPLRSVKTTADGEAIVRSYNEQFALSTTRPFRT
jgi:hypothetical protein